LSSTTTLGIERARALLTPLNALQDHRELVAVEDARGDAVGDVRNADVRDVVVVRVEELAQAEVADAERAVLAQRQVVRGGQLDAEVQGVVDPKLDQRGLDEDLRSPHVQLDEQVVEVLELDLVRLDEERVGHLVGDDDHGRLGLGGGRRAGLSGPRRPTGSGGGGAAAEAGGRDQLVEGLGELAGERVLALVDLDVVALEEHLGVELEDDLLDPVDVLLHGVDDDRLLARVRPDDGIGLLGDPHALRGATTRGTAGAADAGGEQVHDDRLELRRHGVLEPDHLEDGDELRVVHVHGPDEAGHGVHDRREVADDEGLRARDVVDASDRSRDQVGQRVPGPGRVRELVHAERRHDVDAVPVGPEVQLLLGHPDRVVRDGRVVDPEHRPLQVVLRSERDQHELLVAEDRLQPVEDAVPRHAVAPGEEDALVLHLRVRGVVDDRDAGVLVDESEQLLDRHALRVGGDLPDLLLVVGGGRLLRERRRGGEKTGAQEEEEEPRSHHLKAPKGFRSEGSWVECDPF
jgi:hypothetical protein